MTNVYHGTYNLRWWEVFLCFPGLFQSCLGVLLAPVPGSCLSCGEVHWLVGFAEGAWQIALDGKVQAPRGKVVLLSEEGGKKAYCGDKSLWLWLHWSELNLSYTACLHACLLACKVEFTQIYLQFSRGFRVLDLEPGCLVGICPGSATYGLCNLGVSASSLVAWAQGNYLLRRIVVVDTCVNSYNELRLVPGML